ncbi:hypothetical protein [Streptomyces anulatus]|uniref:hypothetical protein n=1 Tax=Streptomyces anulatus TaxID=1892 RepID=UPI003420278D
MSDATVVALVSSLVALVVGLVGGQGIAPLLEKWRGRGSRDSGPRLNGEALVVRLTVTFGVLAFGLTAVLVLVGLAGAPAAGNGTTTGLRIGVQALCYLTMLLGSLGIGIALHMKREGVLLNLAGILAAAGSLLAVIVMS